MITDNEKWHYLAVKKLSALFCEITSKHHAYFCCLNCIHSFSTQNKLKEYKNVCKSHDYCYIEMPKDKSILKYNHGERSTKIQFSIYADMESLLDKIDKFYSNREKLSKLK